MAATESILDSVKQVLGVDPAYTAFDPDVIMHINTSLGILRQMGVGGTAAFSISDNTALWADFFTDETVLETAKSYVYLTCRLLFDPPATSFGLDSAHKLRDELGFRLNVEAESLNPPPAPPITGVLKTAFAPKVEFLDFASVITPNAARANVFYLSLDADCQINAPDNGADGQHITLELTSNGHSVVWGAGWDFGDTGIPTLSADKADIISAVFKEQFAEWHAGYTLGF